MFKSAVCASFSTPAAPSPHIAANANYQLATLFHSAAALLFNTLPFATKNPTTTWDLERSGTQLRLRPSHCRAYVTATNNPIKGNQQKGSVFWDSVKDEFAKECPDGQREVAPIKRFISGELLPDVNQFLSRLRDVYTKQLTVTLPTRSRST